MKTTSEPKADKKSDEKAEPKHGVKTEEKQQAQAPKADVQRLLVQIHRGEPADVTKLSAHEKKELSARMDEESKAEATFKNPSRESVRNQVRAKLG